MQWKRTEYSGWGRAARAEGELARPERLSALERLVADTPAPAIGQRRSYGDVCLNDGARAIDMTRLDRVLGFDADAGEIEVEAGAMLGPLAERLVRRGWILPVMPGTGYATVGGAIANDVHGKNHHHAGSFGQHVKALTLVTAEGAQRITPARQKTLFRATAGGLGQTGVIASATLTLARAASNAMRVSERRLSDWEAQIAALDGSEATYAVSWIDATARGSVLGRGILEEAEIAERGVEGRRKGKSVPLDAPGFALAPPVVRLFNAAYYRRVPEGGRVVTRPMADFFFPLDRIGHWNRLYGKRGFHQFQCVVPLGAADALKAMLEDVAGSGLASPLAVLKRMGPGRGGMMSFPMEGYTLAVDFPNREAARHLIARLETATLDAGGRIYLAKDALASADAVRAMYPEHDAWMKAVAKADPDGRFATDLVRRLDLRSAA